MGFGQHQTFYLRQQWLTKGLLEVNKNTRFFYEPEHFEILGVGKNMAKSIRHWMNVTKLAQDKRTTKTEFVMTDMGKLIFDNDRYVKTPFTLSLLHYLLVTEKNEASSWYWFFNVFNERVFTKQILNDHLTLWVKENFVKEVSSSSIRRDIDCLLQLYTAKAYVNQTPEDVIRSPFESLGLIQQSSGTHYIKTPLYHRLTPSVLYITLVKYLEKYDASEVSLNDLINREELWGRTFNLGRDAIIDYLDEVQQRYPVVFTRTNQLDVIRLEKEVIWLEEIKAVYENEVYV